MIKQMDTKKTFLDTSLWMIVLGNIVSIILAIAQNWDAQQILWVYWGQSVVIGLINIYRMLSLKEFSTKDFKINDNRPPETPATKRQVATFFAIHYGGFHLIYAIFIWQKLPLTSLPIDQIIFLALLILGFVGSHGFSFIHNSTQDFKNQKPNIGTLMFYPYLRIIPMHLIIIFGTFLGSTGTILIFMILKTFADAGMHAIEHHIFRKKL